MNCACNCFEFPSHLGSHILSSRVDLACVLYCWVFKQWYGCQCLAVLTYTRHADPTQACSSVREFTRKVYTDSYFWQKNPLLRRGVKPVSAVGKTLCSTKRNKLHLSPTTTEQQLTAVRGGRRMDFWWKQCTRSFCSTEWLCVKIVLVVLDVSKKVNLLCAKAFVQHWCSILPKAPDSENMHCFVWTAYAPHIISNHSFSSNEER